MDLRFWKKRDISINTDSDEIDPDELSRMRISSIIDSIKEQTLFQKIRAVLDLPLYIIFEELLPYLFFVGVRAVPLWVSIQLALIYYNGPQTPLWIISIAFAQVCVGMRYIKKTDENRLAFFLVTAICAVYTLTVADTPPYYGFWKFMFPVGILLIGPFLLWLRRDSEL